MYKQKEEKFIRVLNNPFGLYNVFPEVANISDEDFIKIIDLYEKKASIGGKDPWNYLYFEELIIMQQCLYEIIKDNYKYRDITAKVEVLFEQELNRRLQRSVREYGEETDEKHRASYAEMPEYAMTLANMCIEEIETSQEKPIESNEVDLNKHFLSVYKEIEKDFDNAGIKMPQKMLEPQAQENIEDISKQIEQQRKEIELLTIQQGINRIENEKLEIEKRVRQISSETLCSFFSKQVSEKYPAEYQTYQQYEKQVKTYKSSFGQITDLKEKLNKVSKDLQFYQGVLPVYESFYQKFEQMKIESKKTEEMEREKEKIYNLIFSEENERLKKSRSLYSAYSLGNKIIPQKYQGLSYDQVEAMIIQEREHERLNQLSQTIRENLINKAIRKDIGEAEDYPLSDLQIKNLRIEFDKYTDEELRSFVAGVKNETKITEVRQETAMSRDEQKNEAKITEVRQEATMSRDEQKNILVEYIESKNSNFGKVAEIISVTGYPDSIYDVKFENGEIHSITITQEEKRNLSSNQISKKDEILYGPSFYELMQEKNKLINDIVGVMINTNEFHDSGLDISQKMRDIEYAKDKLENKSIKELEDMVSFYIPKEENHSTGEIHR